MKTKSLLHQILSEMSVEECIQEMLSPDLRGTTQEFADNIQAHPTGCIFVSPRPGDEIPDLIKSLQGQRRTPPLVCADVEKSARHFVPEAADFPTPMAMGAARDPRLIREMAISCARESRAIGINWTLAPVADINLNFLNCVTNTRSLGDQPGIHCDLLQPWIETLQANGLAATAKHFPGDGVDDRDQHLCTSVNSLPMSEWDATFGRVWKTVIDAGVMAIMPGHISLPAWQGYREDVAECLPATIDPRLLIDLLRERLGFQGVIISDAAVMVGLSSRAPEEERIIQFVEAGGDVYLFADPERDYQRLLKAFESGRITEERIRESASRIIHLKEQLGLFEDPFGPSPETAVRETAGKTSVEAAEAGLTLLKRDEHFPLDTSRVKKVLTITLSYDNEERPPRDLEAFDDELRAAGLDVDHHLNLDFRTLRKIAGDYDCVLLNYYVTQHMKMGTMRLIEHIPFKFWRSFVPDHPCVCHTTFGTPYVEYDLPFIGNLLCTYGPEETSQRAAAKAWLGKLTPKGKCPVRLPKTTVQPFTPYR
ncbi:MAG: hypothetical protein KGY57_05205 [Gammaproteobacteria bacterium]|nr:hypothetical protein [Gammaproteobacteria bacterium]